MPEVVAAHWEHGEDHGGVWDNIATSVPVTDEVSTTGAIGGTYSRRIVFGSNDNFVVGADNQYTRSSTTTALLMGIAFDIPNPASFDEKMFYLQTAGTSGSNNYIGFSIGGSGLIAARAGSNSGATFDNNTSFGTAGPITAGRNYVCFRVVIDETVGEFKLAHNNTVGVDVTGVDTWNSTGSPDLGWGWVIYIGSDIGSSEVVILDDFVLQQDEPDIFLPRIHTALTPNGVTADNDGTIFGGAGSADAALDEIPGTSADGITLDLNGDAQGLTFTDWDASSAGTIRTVQVFGQLGDSAAGSETVRCDTNDGTTTTTGTDLGMSTDFSSRPLTDIDGDSPTGGGWDDTKLDALTATLHRTA